MARARNIKPGFYENEELAECSIWARFIFPGLWMLADRDGRLEDRPKRIKGKLLPFDSQEAEPLLDELEARGFIFRYKAGNQGFIQILAFHKHQNPHHREGPSTIPSPQSLGLLPDETISMPESEPPLYDGQNRGQTEASPRLSPNEVDLVRGVNPADSLIPDSLIPEVNPAAEKPPRFDPMAVRLPACIPPDAWQEWVAYRRKRRLSNTEETIQLQVRRLAEWHTQGHSPPQIIRNSITNGWQGLFEPKARDSPGAKDGSRRRASEILTGRGGDDDSERDITGECQRLA